MHPFCNAYVWSDSEGTWDKEIAKNTSSLLTLVRDREKIAKLNGEDFSTPTLDSSIKFLCNKLNINESELVEYEREQK